MRKDIEIKLGSTVSGRINAVRMSNSERNVAMGAMQDAEMWVDVFSWIAKKIEQLGGRLFLRSALKH